MRRSVCAGAALAAAVMVGAAGCGGGGGEASPEDWKADNSALVAAFSRDLTDALNNINQGARERTVGSCTQVKETAQEVRADALPAPDTKVDLPLTKAVEDGIAAADSCLKGARETTAGARDIEEAQRKFADARKALDEAEAAIETMS